MEMTSSRPFLIRAIYDWIIENRLTPHMLVDANTEGALVPQEYVEQGRIVLNVCPNAVNQLVISNHDVRFNARFNGNSKYVEFPCQAVLAIFAKENGQGMVFNSDQNNSPIPPPISPSPDHNKKPNLKIVK